MSNNHEADKDEISLYNRPTRLQDVYERLEKLKEEDSEKEDWRVSTLYEELKEASISCDSNKNLSYLDLSELSKEAPQEHLENENQSMINGLWSKLNPPPSTPVSELDLTMNSQNFNAEGIGKSIWLRNSILGSVLGNSVINPQWQNLEASHDFSSFKK